MKNRMSSKEKTLIVIIVVAALAALIVLILLITGNKASREITDTKNISDKEYSESNDNKTTDKSSDLGDKKEIFDYNDPSTYLPSISEKKALDEMYILLEGYWITDSHTFIHFFKENNEHFIVYGFWQTGFAVNGKIEGGHATGKYEATLNLMIPEQPASEIDDGYPERKEKIHIDLKDLINYQKVTVKLEYFGETFEGGWHTYEYGGNNQEDAFNKWFESSEFAS